MKNLKDGKPASRDKGQKDMRGCEGWEATQFWEGGGNAVEVGLCTASRDSSVASRHRDDQVPALSWQQHPPSPPGGQAGFPHCTIPGYPEGMFLTGVSSPGELKHT